MTESTASGDPWRKFRAPDKLWDGLRALYGERGRSAAIRALIEWQLDHPEAGPTARDEQLLDFVVRVHLAPRDDGTLRRSVEVLELPNTTGPTAKKLVAEIKQAIVDHFNPPETEPVPTNRTRKAAR